MFIHQKQKINGTTHGYHGGDGYFSYTLSQATVGRKKHNLSTQFFKIGQAV